MEVFFGGCALVLGNRSEFSFVIFSMLNYSLKFFTVMVATQFSLIDVHDFLCIL